MSDRPPEHPGHFLRDRVLPVIGYDAARFARALGLRRATVERLLAGRARVTARVAVRLGALFRTTPQWWLEEQAAWDLASEGDVTGLPERDPGLDAFVVTHEGARRLTPVSRATGPASVRLSAEAWRRVQERVVAAAGERERA